MRSFLALAVLPLLASAYTPASLLFGRSSCDSGDIACGSVCIPSGYTCCPDKQGGCSASEQCQKGDNGEYGCCPNGEVCTGAGGSEFITANSTDQSGATSTSSTSISSDTNAAGSSSGAKALGADALLVSVVAMGVIGGLVEFL